MGYDAEVETRSEREARHRDISRERVGPARNARSDEIEEIRSDRAAALEDTRSLRAEDLAIKNALRHQQVDMTLAQHKARLDTINGSVARTGVALEALKGEVVGIRTSLDRRDAVNVALVEAAAGRGAKKLTGVQMAGIIVMALLALGSLILAVSQSVAVH